MSSWNNAPAYTGATLDSLRESIGTPQFNGATGKDWALVQNGLIIQGGTITFPAGASLTPFPFTTAFTLQVLGVFIQCTDKHAVGVPSTTLSTFTVDHDGTAHDAFWWAIGV